MATTKKGGSRARNNPAKDAKKIANIIMSTGGYVIGGTVSYFLITHLVNRFMPEASAGKKALVASIVPVFLGGLAVVKSDNDFAKNAGGAAVAAGVTIGLSYTMQKGTQAMARAAQRRASRGVGCPPAQPRQLTRGRSGMGRPGHTFNVQEEPTVQYV